MKPSLMTVAPRRAHRSAGAGAGAGALAAAVLLGLSPIAPAARPGERLLAQSAGGPAPSPAFPQGVNALEIRGEPPFRVGEALLYDLSYAFLDAGRLRMGVDGVDTVHGRPAYHLTFRAQTNPTISAIYSLKNQLQSWMDVERLHSLRFVRESVENGERRDKRYRLDQERGVRVNEGTGEEQPMARDAQDDVSILYFLRTLPLREGVRFTLNNLMDPKDNPMRVWVVGTEQAKVPAGTFDCYVLQLDVHTDSGIFSQGGEVKAWLTKDALRMPVKLESKLKVGSLGLALTSFQSGTGTPLAAGAPSAAR